MENSSTSKRSVYVIHHQGLGDLLACIGLYRVLASRHKKLVIPVQEKYLREMKSALSDLENISLVELKFLGAKGSFLPKGPFSSTLLKVFSAQTMMAVMALLHSIQGGSVVRLGTAGRRFFHPNFPMRFDANFYYQANVPFEQRWLSFKYPRNPTREDELFERITPGKKSYAFVHEDQSRGMKIDRSQIDPDLEVVEPLPISEGYLLTDYTRVLLEAREIHLIESSFTSLVEGLGPKAGLFAHRQARREAKGDWRQEPTYKLPWKIITDVVL